MNENIIAKGVLKGALYVSLLSLFLYSIYLLKSIILYIFLAAVVSLIGRPFVIFFVKKLKFNKNIASIFTVSFIILLILGFFSLLVPLIVQQTENLSLLDINLLERLRKIISIPLIFSGGVGKKEHIVEASQFADGIALASILHYEKYQINEIKQLLKKEKINIREEINI